MKIYLSDQRNAFIKHLDNLKLKKVMAYDKSRLLEKTTNISIETSRKLEDLNLDFLFKYQIFPKNIMTYKAQWTEENREMNIGDTIVQQVYIPPIKRFSQKLIFGVRIKEIINNGNKMGFSYETLEGHVEKGISTFTVEEIDNNVIFKVQTYSKPGNIITKLVGPFFSIPYQKFCTKAALNNVKRQLEFQCR